VCQLASQIGEGNLVDTAMIVILRSTTWVCESPLTGRIVDSMPLLLEKASRDLAAFSSLHSTRVLELSVNPFATALACHCHDTILLLRRSGCELVAKGLLVSARRCLKSSETSEGLGLKMRYLDVLAILLALTEVLVVVNVPCSLRHGDGEVLIQYECLKVNKEISKKAFGILSQIYMPKWLSCPPSFLPHLYR
jgi:hypothetical protein